MKEDIDLIEGIITEPADKDRIINEAVNVAGQALGFSYISCGLKTHIEKGCYY